MAEKARGVTGIGIAKDGTITIEIAGEKTTISRTEGELLKDSKELEDKVSEKTGRISKTPLLLHKAPNLKVMISCGVDPAYGPFDEENQ